MEIRPSNSVVLHTEFLQLHELVNEKMKEFQMSLKIFFHITLALLIFEICHILYLKIELKQYSSLGWHILGIFLNVKDLKRGWFSFVSLRLLLKAITPSRNIAKWDNIHVTKSNFKCAIDYMPYSWKAA